MRDAFLVHSVFTGLSSAYSSSATIHACSSMPRLAPVLKTGFLLKHPVSSSSFGLKRRYIVLRTNRIEWHSRASCTSPPLGFLPLHRGSSCKVRRGSSGGGHEELGIVVHTEGRILNLSTEMLSGVEDGQWEESLGHEAPLRVLEAWELAIRSAIFNDNEGIA